MNDQPITILVSKGQLPDDPQIERTPIPIQDIISRDARFKDNAVTVDKVFPAYVTVKVDRMIRKVMKVQIRKEDQEVLARLGKVSFETPSVEVTGPRSLLDPPEGPVVRNVSVEADLSAYRSLKPGRHENLEVPISLAGAAQATVRMPAVARVTIDLKVADEETYIIDTVQVFAEAPVGLSPSHVIRCEQPNLLSVRVVGPPGQIALLKPATTQSGSARLYTPYAILRLTPEDFREADRNPDKQFEKELSTEDFRLPQGVRVVGAHSVKFSIVRR